MDRQKTASQLRISYDKEADVLYLSIGAPKKAISDIEENGVIIRRDPNTNHVLGLTIIDFARNFSTEKAKLISPHLFGQLQFA
ncbi:MAG: DUF2283 domain-containing protein [Candidatus Omnitrophota bacterium]|nr:MAG: DUF2283 domain-containing protein [Candidatus Omnitrophota bacterium]